VKRLGPKITALRQLDTHRLIPAKYTEDDASVLERIATDERHLQDLFDLDHATNDRLLGENGLLPGIAQHELVFGVPYYRIVNATFTHAHPMGGRFNAPDRGAWYAAFEVETSLAEVAFHKSVEYSEIPVLVGNVRRGRSYQLTWSGTPEPVISGG
jgi:hypothetical protein